MDVRQVGMVVNRAIAHARRYGIDAPYGFAGLSGIGIACLASAVLLGRGGDHSPGRGPLLARRLLSSTGTLFLSSSIVYLHTTLLGKFRAWQGLLDNLDLRGDEELLDLGCGRGAVLLAAAQRLPHGRAHGVDLWRRSDQSGNAESVTAANAQAEGVSDRVELRTADITALPFPDASFDVVTSSLAIHNIPSLDARHTALDEALRVLRPGGRLLIADISGTHGYAEHLRQAGAIDVRLRDLGPSTWFGLGMGARAVSATKSEARA
ncbi:MAG TPA: class I SAM-dependent methyltransferase [Pseudonocardiaceae bacterium]